MDMTPNFVPAADVWALRGRAERSARFVGLYVCGNLEALAFPTVAIVGSRAASERGRRIAWRFAAELGKAGVCVVSGLALGIDGAAHAGALSVGAATVGILGSGHQRFFPRRNLPLAQAILEKGGAVLSPFAADEPAFPGRFLQRNGVIAALSDAVVVVEAAARSGSLNTASWAANANIPVLAVPGDIDRDNVAGCHALIRDGATLARNVDDVLEALGIERSTARELPLQLELTATNTLQAELLTTLRKQDCDLEELAAAHRVPLPQILGALAQLTLAGAVYQPNIGTYAIAVGTSQTAFP